MHTFSPPASDAPTASEKGAAFAQCRRFAWGAWKEIKSGIYVNLNIGMPTLVSEYLPLGILVRFQSKNGALVRLLRSGLLGSVWSDSPTKARQSHTPCSSTPTVDTPLGFPEAEEVSNPVGEELHINRSRVKDHETIARCGLSRLSMSIQQGLSNTGTRFRCQTAHVYRLVQSLARYLLLHHGHLDSSPFTTVRPPVSDPLFTG